MPGIMGRKSRDNRASLGTSGGEQLPVYSVVMVGCGGVGKSSLTLRYVFDEFTETYDPTRADSYRRRVQREARECEIDILDTAGQEEYAAIRDNYFRSGDGFMCVFSVTERATFRALPELREQICRAVGSVAPAILLVGNKMDLEERRQVDGREGERLAASWPNCRYWETSAKLDRGVSEAFDELLQLVDDGRELAQIGRLKPDSSRAGGRLRRRRLCSIQ